MAQATITKSFVVKEHFTRAAELNPQDPTSRHLLGVWYYEVPSGATRTVHCPHRAPSLGALLTWRAVCGTGLLTPSLAALAAQVASLSWAMRKVAAAVFASPPRGTYDEALVHFQLAEEIKPGFYVRNRTMLAKCHLALRDKPAARQWATAALELPVVNSDDKTAAAEAKQMLASL